MRAYIYICMYIRIHFITATIYYKCEKDVTNDVKGFGD